MRAWDGARFTHVLTMVTALGQALKEAQIDGRACNIGGVDRENFIAGADFIQHLGEDHDFPVLGHAASDLGVILKMLPQTEIITLDSTAQHQLAPRVDHLLRTAESSLRGRAMFALSMKGHRLFTTTEPLFGQEVFDKFNGAARDIAESGKCLAAARSKAAVFHLMLAMELTVRALANKLGATAVDRNGRFLTWLVILQNMKGKIDPMTNPAEKSAWSEVRALLDSVAHAWRNPTMHPADAYTEEEADAIFESVKAFMRRLAPMV
ncbi:MAG TPA: hypothetical protein VNT30_18395 [Stellaceae bacterium]|nr:hypothetical protein [Stellaceae bacterium]